MNIRQAFVLAADQIAGRPEQFNFMSCRKPGHCGTPGCALGWIGTFLGVDDYGGGYPSRVANAIGLHDAIPFYDRMNQLQVKWTETAPACATALRLYADKYHPESRALIPASVRAIFDMTPAELAREFA